MYIMVTFLFKQSYYPNKNNSNINALREIKTIEGNYLYKIG